MVSDFYAQVQHAMRDWEQPAVGRALEAVVEWHAPEPAIAGVNAARFGPGRCAGCREGGPAAGVKPDRVFWDYLNGSARKVELHQHGVYDFCGVCPGEGYPCDEMRMVAEVLGVAIGQAASGAA